MAAIHPTGPGAVHAPRRGTEAQESRSFREGSAAALLVGGGAVVGAAGLVLSWWWGATGEAIATIWMLVLLPAAVLQAVIALVDGVRDHDSAGESRAAVFGLLGIVAAAAFPVVAVVIGL